jgi:uncharacterized protein YijF (DUF1287 family)
MKTLPVIPLLLFSLAGPISCEKEHAPAPSPPIVQAARAQIGKTVRYDGSYRALDYPNGDVPIESGVCTDVVIRAMRTAMKRDLQKLVHEDMAAHFAEYPKLWGLKRPDKNIDHRRVPNLRTWFKRQGYALPVSKNPEDYKPGDLVTCTVTSGRPHIMIVSNRTNAPSLPLSGHTTPSLC